ncbi:MAG TPA: hypothetical protein VFQ61_08585 [Polyangiaceae bacterium]|jgi:hypothetical protein|nr:hypothetical protein [Polyangiaceae bacterium]
MPVLSGPMPRFSRTVDLVNHFPILADEPLEPGELRLRTNLAALELWGREHISLPEILWTGPNP